ncbi:MAG TPA: cytochrome c peroxidase [Terriglobales bacterium]|jgi:cytochrome c peroxidase
MHLSINRPCNTIALTLLLAGSASAGSITIGLYTDSSTSPGALLTVIGSRGDSQLTSSPVDDLPLLTPFSLTAGTRYWIGISTSDNSLAGWGFTGDMSGIDVASEYGADNTFGVVPNPIFEAFRMRVVTSRSGMIFDSLDFPDPDSPTGFEAPESVSRFGPLYGSFTFGAAENLIDVQVQLALVPAPEPSSVVLVVMAAALLGLGWCRIGSQTVRVKSGAQLVCTILLTGASFAARSYAAESPALTSNIDSRLARVLRKQKFTGRVEATLKKRLGREVDPDLANIGRLLWFDTIGGLHDDNTCGGCHAPATGFGDPVSIAVGIQSNGIVGLRREGPHNQRRTPKALNIAFFPALMWNGRFNSVSGDPFDNSQGFKFPLPEGATRFPPADPIIKHLAQAQGEMPPTELTEVAGYTGTKGTPYSLGPAFDQFDDGKGAKLPIPDAEGYRNDPIRQAVLDRLNSIEGYRELFGKVYSAVKAGAPIDFNMFGEAIAEFEFTLTFANAPIDRFARGDHDAMTFRQKRGALLFFGKANCVSCHAVAGKANEMFSDFEEYNIGVPQISPTFGVGKGNVIFDGPNMDEDFGLEQITGDSRDRYHFRTAPLRNLVLQPAFFHNGSFTRLEDAIRHHLDVYESARNYDPRRAGVERDLRHVGPIEPVLMTLAPQLRNPISLEADELKDLVAFVRDGLQDEKATKKNLCALIPDSVPSGRPLLKFTGCKNHGDKNDDDK